METENIKDKILFEDEFEEESGSVKNILTIVAVLLASVGFIALSWYAYHAYNNATHNDQDKIPTISADHTPTKLAPSDDGGMKFPNMDKQVYNSLSSKNQAPKAEKILPGPEEPIDKEQISRDVANIESEIANEPPVKEVKAPTGADVSKLAMMKDIAAATKAKDTKVIDKLIPVPSEAPQNKLPASIQKINKGSKFAKSDYSSQDISRLYRVQIASFKSESDAKKGWDRQVKLAKNILDQYDFFIEKKIIPEKGLVYRLQVGNFANESDAAELCKKLKNANIDCFTLRP